MPAHIIPTTCQRIQSKQPSGNMIRSCTVISDSSIVSHLPLSRTPCACPHPPPPLPVSIPHLIYVTKKHTHTKPLAPTTAVALGPTRPHTNANPPPSHSLLRCVLDPPFTKSGGALTPPLARPRAASEERRAESTAMVTRRQPLDRTQLAAA